MRRAALALRSALIIERPRGRVVELRIGRVSSVAALVRDHTAPFIDIVGILVAIFAEAPLTGFPDSSFTLTMILPVPFAAGGSELKATVLAAEVPW